MCETIGDFFSKDDRIVQLEKQLSVASTAKCKAQKSRDKLIADKTKVTELMVQLKHSGCLKMLDREIADVLFITRLSVIDARKKMKKAGRLK